MSTSALVVSLLYLVSFWPMLAYLVRPLTPSNHWQPFCLIYSPIAHACPPPILKSYMMQRGLSDIEAFYAVELLRSEETKHTTDPLEFDICY